ncbi:MAG: MBL fold metallo-hydrolase [Verrucomicrobia bacterium]|nr:MBL fold metallo-hydrolase [Verrucomicrobiota bacterium]
MQGELLFLGTGGSMGIPVIGCDCSVCLSKDKKNKRLRTSALLRVNGRQILIDAGPDLRQQALTNKIAHLDGLLLTHAHYDHIGGLDELRIYYFMDGLSVPCFLSRSTYKEVRSRHGHIFEEPDEEKNVTARLDFHILEEERGSFVCAEVPFSYFTYWQGPTAVTGYRMGSLAYVSDIRRYPESLFEGLWGVKILVLSALRPTPSHVHLSVEEAVTFAKRVGAEQTYFIHMAHELEHSATNEQLPAGIALAYDGLIVPFE